MGITGAVTPVQKPIRVAFLDPTPQSPFWKNFTVIMQDAADDLGMKLDLYEGLGWPTANEALLREILTGPQKPDFLVLTVHQGAKARLLATANQAKVPFFVVEAGLLESETKRYGGPRQHFKYWIGQILPENEKAGYDLTNVLANETIKAQPKKPINMIAFGGLTIDQAAIDRLKGLKRAVAERKDIKLKQVITANWYSERTQGITPLMMKRYPDLSAIWSANDQMALGSIPPLRKEGFRPGKGIILGGIGWTPEAFAALKRKELNASFGGSSLAGGWAMALLYDYYHGHDFASERTDWRIELAIATPKNWQTYQPLITPRKYKDVDFRKFSKTLNPNLRRYDFRLSDLVSSKRSP